VKLYKTATAQAELLIEDLQIAETFWTRAKGLLGRKSINENQALWIKPCRDIHTFFMKFPIDCVFLDKNMQVYNIVENVTPFKIIGPFWKASSVIEFKSGFSNMKNLKVGDQLYVVN
jgi:uncharacterized membrane protein (UPF0127 family)